MKLFSPKVLAVTDLKQRNLDLARRYGATHTYLIPSEHASTMETLGAAHPDGFEVVIPCLLDVSKQAASFYTPYSGAYA